MTLPILEFLPDQARYRVRPKGRAIRALYGGSQGRYRRDYDGPPEVSVQWSLDGDQYDDLVGFYRDTLINGSLPFMLDLVVEDGTPETHTARFVPGTFRLGSVEGKLYTLTANLEVVA